MIAFASLFLGLMTGVVPVELVVDGRVASVQLVLDGEPSAQIYGPPWKAEIDLGEALLPHRLEARALDAEGTELASARALINFVRSDYGASIVLGPADDGGRSGNVRWMAALNRQPHHIELRFDGRLLPVAADGGFVLPKHDPGTTHALEALLTFEDGGEAAAELTFGGIHGDRVTSALTAVAVATSRRKAPKSAADATGWLERDGSAVPVFTVKKEPGILLLVRDSGLASDLRWLRKRFRGGERGRRGVPEIGGLDVLEVMSHPEVEHEGTFRLMRLGAFGSHFEILPLLLSDRLWDGRHKLKNAQKLWDSLAIAGLHGATSRRPRAVLLMISGKLKDKSRVDPVQAQRYLASLGVPLYVWSASRDAVADLDLGDSKRVFRGLEGLENAIEYVEDELASQTMIWLEGEVLPSELTLGKAAPEGVQLAR